MTAAAAQPELHVESDKPTLPAMGWHSVGFTRYLSWPALNGGTLLSAIVEPYGPTLNFEAMSAVLRGEVPDKDTDAMRVGRAYHCAALEPLLFQHRFPTSTGCGAILKSGDREGEPCGKAAAILSDGVWWCGKHGEGKKTECDEYLTMNERRDIDGMLRRLAAHPVYRMCQEAGGAELSGLAEIDGVPYKIRADKHIGRVVKGRATIIDLKKCRAGKANASSAGHQMRELGYHIKADMYCRVAEKITGNPYRFIWIWQEESPPYSIYVHEMTETEQRIGGAILDRLIAGYRRGMDRGDWPGPGPWNDQGGPAIDYGDILPRAYIKQQLEQLPTEDQ